MKIDKNKLFQNLKDIKNLVNLNILVCYKKLLDINNIFHNIGSLILICIFVFHIIFIFIFYIREVDNIIQIIKNIINRIKKRNIIKQNKINKNAQKIQKRNAKINNNIIIRNSNKIKNLITYKKPKNRNNINYFRNNKNNKYKSNFNNKIILSSNNCYINNKIKKRSNFI